MSKKHFYGRGAAEGNFSDSKVVLAIRYLGHVCGRGEAKFSAHRCTSPSFSPPPPPSDSSSLRRLRRRCLRRNHRTSFLTVGTAQLKKSRDFLLSFSEDLMRTAHFRLWLLSPGLGCSSRSPLQYRNGSCRIVVRSCQIVTRS